MKGDGRTGQDKLVVLDRVINSMELFDKINDVVGILSRRKKKIHISIQGKVVSKHGVSKVPYFFDPFLVILFQPWQIS